ncbi:MAG: right-handed parallel beta-helix repeat-containing protein [Acidimicrobiia bacterium]
MTCSARRMGMWMLVSFLVTLGFASLGAKATFPATAVAVPPGIDRSGATDVTGALNAFLAGLAPGTTAQFPKGARYRVEGTLLLVNRRDVTIEGNGATFFAATDGSGLPPPRGVNRRYWPRLRQQWRIRGGSGITVRDITVKGANPHGGATAAAYVPSLEGQAGIAIQRTSGVTIESVHVSDTYGDAVYVVGGATNVTNRNSSLERIGRQGVAIVNASKVVVDRNEIRDVARSVFDLEPLGRALAGDVHLSNNTIGDYRNFLLAAAGGGPGVNDIWLEGNHIDGGHGLSVFAGIERQRRTGYHIVGNTGSHAVLPASGTGRSGLLQLTNLDQVEIRGNHQAVTRGPAISLDLVCGLTVAGNEFPGAAPDQQVVAPCGAAAPAPATRSAGPPTTSGAVAVPSSGGGSGDPSWILTGLVGFAAGLGVAAGAFGLWRRISRA